MCAKQKIPKLKEKKWILKGSVTGQETEAVREIADALRRHPLVGELLYLRGYRTVDDAKRFVDSEEELLCDPFSLHDMEDAVLRLRQAIEAGERITVYGDYDVDGVTSVCTMCLYLRSRGGIADYYIPNRSGEGYGVSKQAIDILHQRGTTLIITVDTGITANEEVEYARTLGIDVIVTDHHECRAELPRAVAVINPHRPDSVYPFRELAGVGVVFKVISAYEERSTGKDKASCVAAICREYADLIAIGTIADVMPILGENKLIVKYGLALLEKQKRVGFRALVRAVTPMGDTRNKKTKMTSGYIGYTIAPRLNAAGRILSASLAAELFLTEDADYAERLAKELCDANKERQNEENRIVTQAYAKIEAEHDFSSDKVIVLDADEWHHGVIGIVASRITEKYGLPCILLSFEGCDPSKHSDDDIAKGSGRSVKGMNLVDALVYSSETLVKYGGHELAAGLSVTRGQLPQFKKKINDYARSVLSEEALIPTLEADCEIPFSAVSLAAAKDLQILEPFGVGNPVPTFVLRHVSVAECVPIGGGKHTRFLLADDAGNTCTAICFSTPQAQLDLFVGDRVDLLFHMDINEWCDRRSVQLIVKDIRLSEKERRAVHAQRELFQAIWNGASFSAADDVIPSRPDFVEVYQFVRHMVRSGTATISHRGLLSGVSDRIGYVKLKIIIRVLQEMNLLGIEEIQDEVYCFKIRFTNEKTDLEKSNLLRRLRAQQK